MLEKDKALSNNTVKLIGSLIIFFFMLIYIIAVPNKSNNSQKETGEVNKEALLLLFNQIENKYTLTITKKVNDDTKTLVYSTNSKMNLYEGDLLDKDGYLFFNDKLYYINENDKKLVLTDKNKSFISDPFYNIEMIKRIVNYCDFSYVNEVKARCTLKLSDYFKEYNYKYNTEYKVEEDDTTNIDIVYSTTKIEKVIIDYSKINKIINNSDDTISYGVKIDSVDESTFEQIFSVFKTVIE